MIRPAVDHQDAVGRADRREAVGDDEAGPLAQHALDGVLDEPLGLGVHGAGGLVHDEHLRVGQHRPGQGDQLLLSGGQAAAALADVAVVALLQVEDERARR